MSDLLHTNDRVKKLAADTYQSLDALIRESTADTDDPKHEMLTIEGESLWESFEGFIEMLRGDD